MGAGANSGGGGGSSDGNNKVATPNAANEKPAPSFFARWMIVEEAEVVIHLHSIPSTMRNSPALIPTQQQSVKAEVMNMIGGWQWCASPPFALAYPVKSLGASFRKLSLTCHAEVSLVQLSCFKCSSCFDTPSSEVTAVDYSLFHYPSQESREDAVEVVG